MACIGCGFGGTKQTSKKLPLALAEMKQILESKGFIYVGQCNCHGPVSYTYEHPSVGLWRMEVSATTWWVKNLNRPNPNWNIITYGNQSQFEGALKQYFNI